MVVHDVVYVAVSVLDGGNCRRRSVLDVQPRPHTTTAANDGQAAAPDEVDDVVGCAGPVEVAVTQHDSLEPCAEHHPLLVENGRERLALRGRWVRVERMLLSLDRAARRFVVPAGVALHDKS